jgi:hypothetical protein
MTHSKLNLAKPENENTGIQSTDTPSFFSKEEARFKAREALALELNFAMYVHASIMPIGAIIFGSNLSRPLRHGPLYSDPIWKHTTRGHRTANPGRATTATGPRTPSSRPALSNTWLMLGVQPAGTRERNRLREGRHQGGHCSGRGKGCWNECEV